MTRRPSSAWGPDRAVETGPVRRRKPIEEPRRPRPPRRRCRLPHWCRTPDPVRPQDRYPRPRQDRSPKPTMPNGRSRRSSPSSPSPPSGRTEQTHRCRPSGRTGRRRPSRPTTPTSPSRAPAEPIPACPRWPAGRPRRPSGRSTPTGPREPTRSRVLPPGRGSHRRYRSRWSRSCWSPARPGGPGWPTVLSGPSSPTAPSGGPPTTVPRPRSAQSTPTEPTTRTASPVSTRWVHPTGSRRSTVQNHPKPQKHPGPQNHPGLPSHRCRQPATTRATRWWPGASGSGRSRSRRPSRKRHRRVRPPTGRSVVRCLHSLFVLLDPVIGRGLPVAVLRRQVDLVRLR